MAYDWTLFFDEYASDLHPSFQKELSKQLLSKASKSLRIKNFEKYNFQLIVGLSSLDMQIMNNKVIANVELITPNSFSFTVQINWKSDFISDLTNVHSKDISNLNIEFDWEENIDMLSIKKHLKPYKIDKKSKSLLNFDIEYFYYLLPDLCLDFKFHSPIANEKLKELSDFCEKYYHDWNSNNKNKEFQFISNLSEINPLHYQLLIDLANQQSIQSISKMLKLISDTYPELPIKSIAIS